MAGDEETSDGGPDWVPSDDASKTASPSDPVLSSFLGRRSEGEEAERKATFEGTLSRMFAAVSFAPAEVGSTLRSLVEWHQWYVPLRGDGSFETTPHEREYRLAIPAAAASPRAARRPPRGKDRRLLAIYVKDPGRPAARLDGRSLVRVLPDEIQSLLVDAATDEGPAELGREHFAGLRAMADALDLEDLLAVPGPDQVGALMRATWYPVVMGKKRRFAIDNNHQVRVYTYPEPDALDSGEEFASVDGTRFFGQLASLDHVDGISVNAGSAVGRGEARVTYLVFGPAFARRLVRGDDIRPGSRPLPGRDLAEIELWLSLNRFPFGYTLVEIPGADGPLVQATKEGEHLWQIVETSIQPHVRTGVFRSPLFALDAAGGTGARPTRILCAGLLAERLHSKLGTWRSGRRLPFGVYFDGEDRARATALLAVADELQRLLPLGRESLPRDTILTAQGAAFLREHPDRASRAWIEEGRHFLEQHTKRWLWNVTTRGRRPPSRR